MKNKSFDVMVKYRFHVRPPAHDIVIVDSLFPIPP
jgi:hypothetical protein